MTSKEYEALVEKVARVICFETGSMGDPMPIEMQRVDRDWREHTQAAEAAIFTIRAALKEPTEGMREAGIEAIDDNWERGVMRPAANSSLTCWRAMLAASALGEQSDGI